VGKTLAEKILSQKSGSDARAGNIVVAEVDLVFAQDTTGPLTVRQFQASGFERLTQTKLPYSWTTLPPVLIMDCPPSTYSYATLLNKLAVLSLILEMAFATSW